MNKQEENFEIFRELIDSANKEYFELAELKEEIECEYIKSLSEGDVIHTAYTRAEYRLMTLFLEAVHIVGDLQQEVSLLKTNPHVGLE